MAFKIVNNNILTNQAGDAVLNSLKLGTNDGVGTLTPVILTHDNAGNATLQNVSIQGSDLLVSGTVDLQSGLVTGDVLDMDSNRILNLADPVDDTDAVTKQYVDQQELSAAADTGTVTVNILDQTLTIAGTANQVVTSASGQTITLGLPDNIVVSNNLVVAGNLTVNGTTITNDTSTVAVNDPYITVGGSTPLVANDAKDRGVRFRWHNGGSDTVAGSFVTGHVYIITATGTTDFTLIGATDSNPGTVFTANGPGTGTGTANDELNTRLGFFGFDQTDGSFFYIPDSTEVGEIFSGTVGDAKFGTVTADLIGNVTGNASTAASLATSRSITLSGDATGSASFDGSSDANITVTVADDSHTHDGRYYTEAESDARFANLAGASFTGNISATLFTGNVTGNASSATTAASLTTARNITLSGDASGTGSFDGSSNLNITVTVADDSHTHDGRYYTETESDARFLPLTGGTLSGSLTVSTIIGASGTLGVTGNIVATGDVTAYSDRRFKHNIRTIENALDIVKQLRGVMFDKDGRNSTGLIAQEAEGPFPEIVHTTPEGMKSVAYGNAVGLLIEAIKAQQDQIDALQQQLAART